MEGKQKHLVLDNSSDKGCSIMVREVCAFCKNNPCACGFYIDNYVLKPAPKKDNNQCSQD